VTVNLPDVNVLIALSWCNHIHHTRARRWFADHKNESFATCPITESGFVRLSMNPNVVGEAVTFENALSALKIYMGLPNHRFWPADGDYISVVKDLPVVGYRQTTGAYLLGLAIKNRGRLVTFDRKIEELTHGRKDLKQHIFLIGAEQV